jgi:ribosomal protein S18 acetylase RimI-like enzyme
VFVIRAVSPDDVPFLWDMGWEATAVDPGMRAMGREAAFAVPSVRKYLDGWGRPGDAGVVAVEENGRRLGAAWYRLFPADEAAYGFVAPDVPELSIGVREGARGSGIGRSLLEGLLATAREEGYRAVSLSVDRQNPALRLYERVGFRDAGVSDPSESSVTMMATL